MNVVVVGAKGTLGARLVAELGARGVDFRGGAGEGPDDDARALLAGADVVVNAGGPRVRPGLTDRDYFREHVGVVQHVLAAMRRGAHLVHVSSTAVFGAKGRELGPGDRETPDGFPMPGYAAAKLAAETYARAGGAERGVVVTVLRPSMVYGEGIDSALASLARLSRLGVALSLRPASLRQHLVHVDLFVASVRAAVERGGAGAFLSERPLLVADPFVLRNAELHRLTSRGFFAVPVPLDGLAWAASRLAPGKNGVGALRVPERARLALESFAVLALDVVFDTRETWEKLALSPDDFARERTFDRAFASPRSRS